MSAKYPKSLETQSESTRLSKAGRGPNPTAKKRVKSNTSLGLVGLVGKFGTSAIGNKKTALRDALHAAVDAFCNVIETQAAPSRELSPPVKPTDIDAARARQVLTERGVGSKS